MVAFRINNEASNLISEPTANDGIDDQAQDFRYADNNSVKKLDKLATTFNFLKYVPLLRPSAFCFVII